jgi:hypothetical protein
MEFSSLWNLREKLDAFLKEVTATITTEKTGTVPVTYQIGDRGPAGGWVFYDKGVVLNGWRYLEAAPVETEFSAHWGAYEKNVPGTSAAPGTGKRNTQAIVDYLRSIRETGKAAQLCASLNFDGHSDWFLPSKDELNLMYVNLKRWGLGGFQNGWYWSSTQYNGGNAWEQRFSDGYQVVNFKNSTGCVRAVRAF